MREYQVGSQSAVDEGFCLRLIRNSPPRNTSKTKRFRLKQTQSRSIGEPQMSVFEFYELSAWPLYITTVSYVTDPLRMNISSSYSQTKRSFSKNQTTVASVSLWLYVSRGWGLQHFKWKGHNSAEYPVSRLIHKWKLIYHENTNTFSKTKRMYCMINECPSLSHNYKGKQWRRPGTKKKVFSLW